MSTPLDTVPFRSIWHIPVTVTLWISSTLRHRQPVTVTGLKNSTLGKAQTASKWQFWMHFVVNWDGQKLQEAKYAKTCRNGWLFSELSFGISALSHVGSTQHRSWWRVTRTDFRQNTGACDAWLSNWSVRYYYIRYMVSRESREKHNNLRPVTANYHHVPPSQPAVFGAVLAYYRWTSSTCWFRPPSKHRIPPEKQQKFEMCVTQCVGRQGSLE